MLMNFESIETSITSNLPVSHNDMSELYGVFFRENTTPETDETEFFSWVSNIKILGYNMIQFNMPLGITLITVIILIIFTDFKLVSISQHHIMTGLHYIHFKIEILHRNILSNIDKCNDFQDMGVENPSNSSVTETYYYYNAQVKKEMSILRKYEIFLLRYKPTYKRKPLYVGEELDDVNTY